MASSPLVTRHSALDTRRGSALFIALVVICVLAALGLGLANSSAQALYLTRVQVDQARAFNAAESGAERAVLYMRDLGGPPAGSAPFDPFGGVQSLGQGSYQVSVDPDDSNDLGDRKCFTIRATGASGTRQETVEVYLQAANFGRYAYFTDTEDSPITGTIFFKPGDTIDGPAHSNNSKGDEISISREGAGPPIFLDDVTVAGGGFNWKPDAPGSEAEWKQIFKTGSKGYKLNVNTVPLPATTDRQKVAAWGAASGFPATDGVSLPESGGVTRGGVFIHGDAQVRFSVSGTRQIITVTQGTTDYTVTINPAANQTRIQASDGSIDQTSTGTTNGVIYSTGNITGLNGEIADNTVSGSTVTHRSAYTVATDVANGKDVTITDNLKYQTEPDKSREWDDPQNLRAATLGIVSADIRIATSAPDDLTIDGVMMAGAGNTPDGSFSALGWDSRGPGNLHLHGGVIQKMRGPVGTFDGATQKTGFSKDYSYDPRMRVQPPPYFPTTGAYDRLSWRRTLAGPLSP